MVRSMFKFVRIREVANERGTESHETSAHRCERRSHRNITQPQRLAISRQRERDRSLPDLTFR
jgi:hypothetical protein